MLVVRFVRTVERMRCDRRWSGWVYRCWRDTVAPPWSERLDAGACRVHHRESLHGVAGPDHHRTCRTSTPHTVDVAGRRT